MSRMIRLLLATVLASAMWTIAGTGTAAASCVADTYGNSSCTSPGMTRTRDIYASERPSYIGWARVRSSSGWGTACSSNSTVPCDTTFHHSPVPAWRWTGSSWTQTSIEHDTWVYAYPYASGWTWAWTQATGWMAVRSDRVYITTITTSCFEGDVNVCPQPL